jgi:S-formylglutathione hydrolase FrmB
MAFIECNFFSEALGMSSSMNVILPESTDSQIGMKGVASEQAFPTLYLLHGYSDDHTIWMRRTSIERYVSELGFAVVMPNVHKSFYTNMKFGDSYWDFISEELPSKVQSLFKVSSERKDNFVAGLSMGGYGAFKLGLKCPEKFSAAASLSGVLDLVSHSKPSDNIPSKYFRNIFGESPIDGTENDLFFLKKEYTHNKIEEFPVRFYQCCGTEDFLYSENINFKEIAKTNLNIDLTYEEEAGAHEWSYWDKKIQRVLQWIQEDRK